MLIKRKYNEKIGGKKILRLPNLKRKQKKKVIFFRLVTEYFLLTKIKSKLQEKILIQSNAVNLNSVEFAIKNKDYRHETETDQEDAMNIPNVPSVAVSVCTVTKNIDIFDQESYNQLLDLSEDFPYIEKEDRENKNYENFDSTDEMNIIDNAHSSEILFEIELLQHLIEEENLNNNKKLYLRIKKQLRQKLKQIKKFKVQKIIPKIFKKLIWKRRTHTRFYIKRKLPKYYIQRGVLTGLKNKYYKPYMCSYARFLRKKSKKTKRKNHFGNVRTKFKEVTIKSYIGLFATLENHAVSYATLIKTNKVNLVKHLFALKYNKKIPPKYKRIRRFTLKLTRSTFMRFQKLIIPEFDFWSNRILQQINGEY